MKKLSQTIKYLSKTAVGCMGFVIVVSVLSFGINITRAAWEEPAAQPPAGNIYAPLNVGPDDQAKKGRLLLDPLFNPMGTLPGIDYPLEVQGPQDVYINNFEIVNNLTVDTDTLYVTGETGRVGIGTITPATKLEVAGGTLNVGSDSIPIDGVAITTSTDSDYGIYGQSLIAIADEASVFGSSVDGIGVYGLNTSLGYGIYAESMTDSAVIGITFADYSGANVIAGIYGRARGLGAWAGYFAQRFFGSDDIVGRKFVPNRLQYSQIPYTAGWEVREVEDAEVRVPEYIAFDGTHLWVSHESYDENYITVMDPNTAEIVYEFRDGDSTRNINKIIYADGYIWLATDYSSRPYLIKIDINNYTILERYEMDPASGTVIDMVYDNSGYIWTANNIGSSNSVSRLTIGDGSIIAPANNITGQCYGTDLENPSGITYDNSDLWLSFGENDGEAVVIMETVGPYSFSIYCDDVVDKNPTDIAYDSFNDRIWVSFMRNEFVERGRGGLGKFLLTGVLEQEYTYNIDPAAYPYFEYGIEVIKFDGQSAGGPYIWASRRRDADYSYLMKFHIGDEDIKHVYNEAERWWDFIFDRNTAGGPYVWGTHRYTGSVTRSLINNPYSTDIFVLAGVWVTSDLVFDGTYIWMGNAKRSSRTIGKYRASDGQKVGDYYAGRSPREIIYDGTSIWATNYYSEGVDDLTQINAADGQYIGGYTRSENSAGSEAVYDGQHMWISYGRATNTIERIKLSNCIPATNSCSGAGTNVYSNLVDANEENMSPYGMIFDGQDLWVTHSETDKTNRLSKITYDDTGINVEQTLTVFQVDPRSLGSNLDPNIYTMEFDGTYIWIGTTLSDSEGNSVYKIDPRGLDVTDGKSGVCDNSSDGCASNAECGGGTCQAVVAGKFPIYHEPSKCSAEATNADRYCSKDADCDGGTCLLTEGADNGLESGVTELVFDGINMWVFNGTYSDNKIGRECNDGLDNDGDGDTDTDDSNCENQYDLREGARCDDGQDNDHDGDIDLADTDCTVATDDTEGNPECSDGLDNDGNGLCDFDGAISYPGCSGKPDPGCTSAIDISETKSWNSTHLTRIVAATDQIVESVYLNAKYCMASGLVFDGNHVWYSGCKHYSLGQYYSGSGQGLTDLAGSVELQPINLPSYQPGSFSIGGSGTFGANLTVAGDLVVQGNTWSGASDNPESFGIGCDDGEFAKGVDTTAGSETLKCRPL